MMSPPRPPTHTPGTPGAPAQRRADTPPVSNTRQRILDCARELFSTYSFVQVSLKDIARRAGVSPTLIIKHFQSKAHLFAVTVDFRENAATLFAGDFQHLGRTAITATLTTPHTAHYSVVRTLMVTGGSSEALTAIGDRIKSDMLSVLTERIAREAPYQHPSPELRAQMALSMLTGISVMRRVGDTGFDDFDPREMITHYAKVIQDIVNGHPNP